MILAEEGRTDDAVMIAQAVLEIMDRIGAGGASITGAQAQATLARAMMVKGKWAEAQAHEHQRMPGNVSRWNATKDLSFVPLRPDLVVEVAYDQMEGDRFRHTAQFRRWRPDREPESCTYEQLDSPDGLDLAEILPVAR